MARTKWNVRTYTVSLRLRITAAMDKQLTRWARNRRKTVSQVVRDTLEEEMSKEQTRGKH